MKKIASILLTLVMILSLSTTAFAAKNDSITVNGAKAGETYNLYKLFDLIVDDEENPTKYAYTINSAWANFFASDGAGARYITVENGYVTDITDAAGLAKEAKDWAGKPSTPVQSIEAAGTEVVFDGLENGYWLITSTLGTVAMTRTTPDDQNVTVNEKNPEDSITKEVKEDSTGEYGDNNDAQVGDTVEFKSTVVLNPHTTNVKIHDTMDSGLTYNNDVKVYTNADMTAELGADNYTVQETPDAGDTFTISFTQAYLDTITAQTTLYLNYTAVLNANAIVQDENGVAIVDQNNETNITYGNSQSVTDQTTTTTHKSTVDKYSDGIENLAGAVFSLKKNGTIVPLVKLDNLNYRVAVTGDTNPINTFVTVDSGDIVIWGLDTDTDYTLEEITAPNGYNKLPNEVNLTVNANDNYVNRVENKSGTVLPETGAEGTMMFITIGSLLAMVAVVFMVTRKKMSIYER